MLVRKSSVVSAASFSGLMGCRENDYNQPVRGSHHQNLLTLDRFMARFPLVVMISFIPDF